jgi:hypothetical protein
MLIAAEQGPTFGLLNRPIILVPHVLRDREIAR